MTKKHLPYLLLVAFIVTISLIFLSSRRQPTEIASSSSATNPSVATDSQTQTPPSENTSVTSAKSPVTRPVTLHISPLTQPIAKDKSSTFEVSLTTSEPIPLNIAGIDLLFDPKTALIKTSRCGETFSSVARNEIVDTTLYLSCFKPAGTGRTDLVPGQKLVIGYFDLIPQLSSTFTLTIPRIAVPASGGYNTTDSTASFSFSAL